MDCVYGGIVAVEGMHVVEKMEVAISLPDIGPFIL